MQGAFKEIFTGGACNPDGTQQQTRNQNPFMNLLDKFFTGRSNVRQKLEGFYPEEQLRADPNFAQFEQEWNAMSQQMAGMHMSPQEMDRLMHETWHQEKLRFEEMERMRMFENEQMWKEAQIAQENNQVMKEWKKEFFEERRKEIDTEFQDAFEQAQTFVESEVNVQEKAKEVANDMISSMMVDPDPRFQNSKFLAFLNKIQAGEIVVEENSIKYNTNINATQPNKESEASQQELFENAFNDAFKHVEENKEDTINADTEKILQDAFDSANEKINDPDLIAKQMEEEYQKLLQDLNLEGNQNFNDIFADAWQKAQDLEEAEVYGDVNENYAFSKENPFLNDNKPLETAMKLIVDGRSNDAILALESHLQKHSDDVNSWRILGRLHQENDQDRIAITCLLNAHKIDPKNLDTLLALGISCTNILDEVQAMNHLKHWLLNNKNYEMIHIDPNVIPNEGVGDMWSMEDIKAMNGKMLNYFQEATKINPTDPELLTSLAVLHFISRDYYNSVALFDQALKYDSENYSLWNKLGATLAHLGRTEEAINAYHRALELKPNYVRVWANLGIAHAFKGDYEEAIRFYLNALSLNPKAKHVWNYMQTAFVCMERYDLVMKIKDMDVNAFRDEFEIIKIDDLPRPEMEYKQLTEKFLIKDNVEKWLNEYQDEQLN